MTTPPSAPISEESVERLMSGVPYGFETVRATDFDRVHRELIEARKRLAESPDVAACTAHRACCGTEHDPSAGKLHGCCVVCGVPWPCDTAKHFIRTPAGNGNG